MATLKTRFSSVAYPILIHLLNPLLQSSTLIQPTRFTTLRIINRASTRFQSLNAPTVTVVVGLAETASVAYQPQRLQKSSNRHTTTLDQHTLLLNHHEKLLNEHTEQLADIEL